MVDRVPAIDEIDDAEKLEVYLRTRPEEEAKVLAFRSAVRVMPVIEERLNSQMPTRLKLDIAASVFRCVLIAWVAGNFPDKETSFAGEAAYGPAALASAAYAKAAWDSKSDGGISSTSTSAAVRAAAVLHSSSDHFASLASSVVNHATSATIYVSRSSLGAAIDLWVVTRSDLRLLRDLGASSVLQSKLWEDQALSDQFKFLDAKFYQGLLDLGEHWKPVWEFYYAVRAGLRHL